MMILDSPLNKAGKLKVCGGEGVVYRVSSPKPGLACIVSHGVHKAAERHMRTLSVHTAASLCGCMRRTLTAARRPVTAAVFLRRP
jgi:hypothetical protein